MGLTWSGIDLVENCMVKNGDILKSREVLVNIPSMASIVLFSENYVSEQNVT